VVQYWRRRTAVSIQMNMGNTLNTSVLALGTRFCGQTRTHTKVLTANIYLMPIFRHGDCTCDRSSLLRLELKLHRFAALPKLSFRGVRHEDPRDLNLPGGRRGICFLPREKTDARPRCNLEMRRESAVRCSTSLPRTQIPSLCRARYSKGSAPRSGGSAGNG
jgi:hypothetical protein